MKYFLGGGRVGRWLLEDVEGREVHGTMEVKEIYGKEGWRG